MILTSNRLKSWLRCKKQNKLKAFQTQRSVLVLILKEEGEEKKLQELRIAQFRNHYFFDKQKPEIWRNEIHWTVKIIKA